MKNQVILLTHKQPTLSPDFGHEYWRPYKDYPYWYIIDSASTGRTLLVSTKRVDTDLVIVQHGGTMYPTIYKVVDE